VSLIESALEKLRRVGDPVTQTAVAAPRTVVVAASTRKAPAVAPPPAREYIHKRIAIDQKALRKAGYLPDQGLERRFADHYRQIKRPLIDKAFSGGADMRLILVSSALPGDGKTFTSLNLALSIARERDVSVLLVDADAPKARISEVLGIRGERGLLDALADESLDVESLIVQTDVRGFEVLPAGKFVEAAPELLASARMDQIAARLGARNARGLVVFDSAPLLVSSEARALLRVPGQVALVVRVGVTPRQAALDAAAHVDKRKLQGLILNQATFAEAGGYYGYSSYGESGDETRDVS
jgi:protein-tyrosine kinase